MLTLDRIREAVQTVASQYEIEQVYLFGSYARGDATEDSDVDFRIVGGNIPTLFELGGLFEELIESLDRPVDIVLTKNIRQDFYNTIKEEEMLIYGKI